MNVWTVQMNVQRKKIAHKKENGPLTVCFCFCMFLNILDAFIWLESWNSLKSNRFSENDMHDFSNACQIMFVIGPKYNTLYTNVYRRSYEWMRKYSWLMKCYITCNQRSTNIRIMSQNDNKRMNKREKKNEERKKNCQIDLLHKLKERETVYFRCSSFRCCSFACEEGKCEGIKWIFWDRAYNKSINKDIMKYWEKIK